MITDINVDKANRRYREITANLPKDENGFTGRNAAEKFDNMMVYLTMAITGDTEQQVRLRRKQYVEELKDQALQKSMAETCP